MYALILLLIMTPSWNHVGMTPALSVTHVDSFINKLKCEEAGRHLQQTFKDVEVQYSCVLEID